MLQINWAPHVLRMTKPGDKVYYIIRRYEPTCGLFAYVLPYLGHIRYALANGMLPVVDMKYHPNSYLDPKLLGKANAWEYYFCQPLGISLEEAYSGSNVIMSSSDSFSPSPGRRILSEHDELLEWRMLVKLGLLKVQPALYSDIMAERDQLIAEDDRVLGVLVRGTDYVSLQPRGHSIPPSIEIAINAANNLRKQWNCNKIFLATEDYRIVIRFKEFFKDACVITNRAYIKYDGQGPIGFYHLNRANDFFLLGKEYLTQIMILSKCNCLLASICGGSIGAALMADGFEKIAIFNLGTYPGFSPPPCGSELIPLQTPLTTTNAAEFFDWLLTIGTFSVRMSEERR